MELKEKFDQLGNAFDEFKKKNDERLAQIEKKAPPILWYKRRSIRLTPLSHALKTK